MSFYKFSTPLIQADIWQTRKKRRKATVTQLSKLDSFRT